MQSELEGPQMKHSTFLRVGASRILMHLAATQQPLRDMCSLKRCALGRRMGREITRHPNQNAPARIAVAPLAELPHASLQHLVGVKARILPEQPACECRNERLWRVAEREVSCDQPSSRVDLLFAIECL